MELLFIFILTIITIPSLTTAMSDINKFQLLPSLTTDINLETKYSFPTDVIEESCFNMKNIQYHGCFVIYLYHCYFRYIINIL